MSTPNPLAGALTASQAIPFVYQTPNIATLAPTNVAQVALPFDQDSNFIWQKIAFFCDLAGAGQTDSTRVLPLVTVQITDSGNSQGFMNAPVPIPALLGDGRLPAILPQPLIVRPNSTLQFNFANYATGVTYNNIRAQLIGIKRFLS